MISVDGTIPSQQTMRVSSFEIGTLVKVERDPDDCTTSNYDNGKCRLITVKNGGKLHLSWVHLAGGHVGLTYTNVESTHGGLVYLHGSNSKLHAIGTTFGTGSVADVPIQKAAYSGGAIAVRAGPTVILEDSNVIGNWADSEGGGITATVRAKVSLIRTSIRGNKITTSRAAAGGGGIAVVLDSLLISVDSIISDNTAPAGKGGGVHMRYGCDSGDVDGCNRVILATTVRAYNSDIFN